MYLNTVHSKNSASKQVKTTYNSEGIVQYIAETKDQVIDNWGNQEFV